MLEFKQTDTTTDLYLTLTELATMATPNYLFVLTQVTTQEVVAFVKLYADDLSLFKERYNKFTIDPSALFTGKTLGEWDYVIYEQASASNTDPALATGILEYGKVYVDRDPEFSYVMYNPPTTYSVYNG